MLLLFVLGLLYDKTDLINAYDDDKAMIADELQRLERQQAIRETDVAYDYKNHRFGTSEISAFYRVLPTKKGSPEPEKPFLVAGVGFEPTTFWL